MESIFNLLNPLISQYFSHTLVYRALLRCLLSLFLSLRFQNSLSLEGTFIRYSLVQSLLGYHVIQLVRVIFSKSAIDRSDLFIIFLFNRCHLMH